MTSDETFACLQNAFRTERLGQAYVIIGPPRREGREVTDRVLQMLFCEDDDGPCADCGGCARAAAHTHPDLLWIEPQKKSRIISIEQVRELQDRVYKTTFQAAWKACVLAGADRMGEAAANAFLKTLEEPPARSLFLLLTDAPQFLLPTILSRCQPVTVSTGQGGLPDEWRQTLLEILVQRAGTGGVITSFARADRVVRLLKEIKATVLAAEQEIAALEELEEVDETIEARASSRYRELRTGVLREILRWYGDLLLLSCHGDDSAVHHTRQTDILKERAAQIAYEQAIRSVRSVEEMNRQLERNMPENHVLAAGFCRLMG